MATIPEALAIAVQHHQAGRLQSAEQIYRQVLAVEPNQADAWHLLGLISHQLGRQGIAIEYIGRAIALKADSAAFHLSLGGVYCAMQRFNEGAACYRRAAGLKPDAPEPRYNLGGALMRLVYSDNYFSGLTTIRIPG
jgi:protein O-GlcNAc transferase